MIPSSLMNQCLTALQQVGNETQSNYPERLIMKIYLDLLKYICICGLSFLFGCWFVLFLVFWWCSWNVLIENGHFIQMSQSLFNWASYLLSLPIGICRIAAVPYSHIMADHVWPQNVNKHLQVFFDYCKPFVLKNNSVCSWVFQNIILKLCEF